ncbi:TPA: hypothetical protein KML26_004168 [Escherichia coli]|nr:hypothetical protein [Escherichia coli]
MKKWKYLKGCEDDFAGHDTAYLVVKSGSTGEIFYLSIDYAGRIEVIEGCGDVVIAYREPITDEQDLNDCIGAPEADLNRGGFIPNTTFVGGFLPEGYPTFGHTNCRCKSVKVGETHIDGKCHEAQLGNKYLHEIKPGVFVDVYDVLMAWNVTNPALQHLIKKALQPGERGHKSREQDLQDIIDSAIRAKELEIK